MKKAIMLAVCLLGFVGTAQAEGKVFLQPKVDSANKFAAVVQLKPAPQTKSPCALAKEHLKNVLAGFEANCSKPGWEDLAENIVDQIKNTDVCENDCEGDVAEARLTYSQELCAFPEDASLEQRLASNLYFYGLNVENLMLACASHVQE